MKPDITLDTCVNKDLFDKKIEIIEESGLNDEKKEIMKMFAYRFLRIDFEMVANYYAFNASEEEKRIMERLRLVLVDGAIDGFYEDNMLRVNDHFAKEVEDGND